MERCERTNVRLSDWRQPRSRDAHIGYVGVGCDTCVVLSVPPEPEDDEGTVKLRATEDSTEDTGVVELLSVGATDPLLSVEGSTVVEVRLS